MVALEEDIRGRKHISRLRETLSTYTRLLCIALTIAASSYIHFAPRQKLSERAHCPKSNAHYDQAPVQSSISRLVGIRPLNIWG